MKQLLIPRVCPFTQLEQVRPQRCLVANGTCLAVTFCYRELIKISSTVMYQVSTMHKELTLPGGKTVWPAFAGTSLMLCHNTPSLSHSPHYISKRQKQVLFLFPYDYALYLCLTACGTISLNFIIVSHLYSENQLKEKKLVLGFCFINKTKIVYCLVPMLQVPQIQLPETTIFIFFNCLFTSLFKIEFLFDIPPSNPHFMNLAALGNQLQ